MGLLEWCVDRLTGTRIGAVETDPLMAEFNIDDWRIAYFNYGVHVPNGDGLWDRVVFRHTGGFIRQMDGSEAADRAVRGTLWSHLEALRYAAEAHQRYLSQQTRGTLVT